MLTLKRKVGEVLVINKDIYITFNKLNSNGSLEIAINAPKNISVDRLEIHNSKNQKP